jgi:hypothetical protein
LSNKNLLYIDIAKSFNETYNGKGIRTILVNRELVDEQREEFIKKYSYIYGG